MNAYELADELERPNNWQQENNFTTRAATMLRQQQAEINQQQEEKKALYNLVAEQDKKIIDLAFKLAYAERGNEVVKEAKYGITTKWDGITTYHETNELIGKAQE
jgi:hypothetical protein